MRATLELSSPVGADRVDIFLPLPEELRARDGEPARRRARSRRAAHASSSTLGCERWGAFALGPALVRARDRLGFHAWEAQVGARAAAARLSERRDAAHDARAARDAGVHRQPGLARARRRHRVRRHPRVGARRPRRAASTGARARGAATLWVNEQHPERNTDVVLFLDTFTDVPHGRARHARPDGPRGDVARAPLSPAQGPRRRRELRRLPLVAPARVRDAAALPDRRLAAADGRRAELRREGDRHPAAAHAAAEGARARADAAPRRAVGGGAARSARARLRPRRDRGLPRSVRAARAATSCRSSRTGSGACRASRCACGTSRPACRWSSGRTASRSKSCSRR